MAGERGRKATAAGVLLHAKSLGVAILTKRASEFLRAAKFV